MRTLSRKQIESIANEVLEKYESLSNRHDYRINPSEFAKQFMNLEIEYAHLSLSGETLGLTSFCEIGIEVYDCEGNSYWYILDSKTIMIEQELKDDIRKEGLLNFTIMHECCHHLLKQYFPKDYGAESKSNGNNNSNWEEWQVNTLASYLLLPERYVLHSMYLFDLKEPIRVLNRLSNKYEYDRFCDMANYLGVSKQALAIRMKELGLLEKEYLYNPYKMLDVAYT